MCATTLWIMSILEVLEFLYVTIVNPRFLKWHHMFRKICRTQPKCIQINHSEYLLKKHAEFYVVC
jgi:hypothetical protein